MSILTGLRRILSRDSAEKALQITAGPARETTPPLKLRAYQAKLTAETEDDR
jgi:hypothetical protein